jgi:hypothetical protein
MKRRPLAVVLALMAWAGIGLAQEASAPAVESAPSPATAAAAPASALPPRLAGGLDLRAERTRIDSERSAARARQAEEEADCQKRFAVTDCMNRTRRKWQPVLAEIKRQEIALNEVERKQRAAEQQRRLDDKVSPEAQEAAAQRRAQALADHEARQLRAAEKASGPTPAGKPRDPQVGGDRSGPGLTAEQAQANAQAHARRVQEAQERKAQAQKRQAERAKPTASALAVPR